MLRIQIIAAGKNRAGSLFDLWNDYIGRIKPWNISLVEIDAKSTAEEHKKISSKINNNAYLFALDEKGKSLRSMEFAKKIGDLAENGREDIQFIIGGADGLSNELRQEADFLLSFGVQTWPHMMVRAMLAEQIYRAQQILIGHPYHRE